MIKTAYNHLKRIFAQIVRVLNQQSAMVGDVYVYRNGQLVFSKKNMVVNNGLAHAAQAAFQTGYGQKVMCMGLGTNGRATQPTDVNMVAPIDVSSGVARKAFDGPVGVTAAVATMTTTFAPGECTGTIAEAGIFLALTGNVLFARLPFPTPIPKGANDDLRVTWVCTAVRP